eukprot:2321101-Rhodomonas_salina.2
MCMQCPEPRASKLQPSQRLGSGSGFAEESESRLVVAGLRREEKPCGDSCAWLGYGDIGAAS